MNVLEKEDRLLPIRLAIKSIDTVTDAEAEKIFLNAEVQSEDELTQLIDYLQKYRPEVYKALSEKMQK